MDYEDDDEMKISIKDDFGVIKFLREYINEEGTLEETVNLPRLYEGEGFDSLLSEHEDSIWFCPITVSKEYFNRLSDEELLEFLYDNSYTMQ